MIEKEKQKMNILDERERIRKKAKVPASVQVCTHARRTTSNKGNIFRSPSNVECIK